MASLGQRGYAAPTPDYSSPISRLLGNILSEIFLSLRDLLKSGNKNRQSNLPWIRYTTHICRYWRRLAISSPFLWTRIIAESPQITALLLERSGDLSLDIVGDIAVHGTDGEDFDRKMTSITPCFGRVRSLDLRIQRNTSTDILLDDDSSEDDFSERDDFIMDPLLQDRISSLLRPLNPYAMADDGFLEDTTTPAFVTIPHPLPQVQELRLTGFPWRSVQPIIPSCIRKLELNIFGGYYPPSIENILDAIEPLAAGLEELTLRDGLPDAMELFENADEDSVDDDSENDDSDDSNEDAPKKLPSFDYLISLPHLKELNLDGPGASCATILRHLEVSPGIAVSFRLAANPEFEDLSLVIDAIARTLPLTPGQGSESEIRSLDVVWGPLSSHGVTLSAWTTSFPPSSFFALLDSQNSPTHLPTPLLKVNLVDYDGDDIINALFRGLPFQNVTMLSLRDVSRPRGEEDVLETPRLTALLHQLPSIETMSISQFLAKDLPVSVLRFSEGGNRSILPNLKVLNTGRPAPRSAIANRANPRRR